MKCPACSRRLSEIQVGAVKVDVCDGGCGGIWFDAFELQRVDDQFEASVEPLVHIQRDPAARVDFGRKRNCPRCECVKLHRHFYSAKRRVEVDHCPGCAGYWLDAGELENIHEERAGAESVEKVRQSYLSTEVIRYLYRIKVTSKPKG